jgi:phosphate:Na+ symporter
MHGVDTILNLVGSVALLLWGVRMVRTGLTRALGAALRRAIGACSKNRFTAFAGGLGLTGLLQSSTATALLLASFAGRGLIPLSIALAVMLGANVGTTLTSQVLSFDLGWLSPLPLVCKVFYANLSHRLSAIRSPMLDGPDGRLFCHRRGRMPPPIPKPYITPESDHGKNAQKRAVS